LRYCVCTLLRFDTKCHIWSMTTAEDIEKAVEQLAPRELARNSGTP
jgi:hypothetical protein